MEQAQRLSFADSADQKPPQRTSGRLPWKVLLVDDERAVHDVTKLALEGFYFGGRALEFLSAFSAGEAMAALEASPDIAVVLLDVVMETEDAGLRVVRYLREDLGNPDTRVILRTGQPGHAPEREVVREYDINDYKEKTELTSAKLSTSLYSALRAYRDIRTLRQSRRGLERVIGATETIFRTRGLEQFCRRALEQLSSLLCLGADAVDAPVDGIAAASRDGTLEIVAATGRFESRLGDTVASLGEAAILEAVEAARRSKTKVYRDRSVYAAHFETDGGRESVVCVQGGDCMAPRDHRLADLFLKNLSVAFDNLHLHQDLAQEVAERREAERRAAILARLPGELPEPVVRIRFDGVVLYANDCSAPVVQHLTGAQGEKLTSVWSARIADMLEVGRRFDTEITQDGRLYEISFSPVVEAGYVNVFGRDVTEYRALMGRLEHAAFHDDLTGLANRLAFTTGLEQAVAAAERNNNHVGLMLIDLDDFKTINDVWGHEAGDETLREVANRLRKSLRRAETISRLGGDEFGVILTGLASADEMSRPARRILEEVSKPIQIGQAKVFVTCSIGITAFPGDAGSAAGLQRCADLAMYQAKREQKAGFRYYDGHIHLKVRQRTRMELAIRSAIEDRRLEVFYQPIVSLATGDLAGLEALVRLREESDGLLLPGRFIHIAEQAGLIHEIGLNVLDTVGQDLRRWSDQGLGPPRVAVNVSAQQLRRRSLPADMAAVLRRYELPPSMLEVEITESALVTEGQPALERLGDLREIGLGLTIDDFGTGYSSLGYLRCLPISKLKIDRAFVADLPANADAAAIVEAILSIGRSLDLEVVAEGIETAEQRDWLRAGGCREGQGYLLGEPRPAPELAERIGGKR